MSEERKQSLNSGSKECFHFVPSPILPLYLMAVRPPLQFTLSPRSHQIIFSIFDFPFSLSSNLILHSSSSINNQNRLLLLRQFGSKTSSFSPPPTRSSEIKRIVRSSTFADTLAQRIGKSIRRPGAASKARVYSDVNVVRPKDYWDYEALTVQWGSVFSFLKFCNSIC